MASNRQNQGGDNRSGSSDRGFASMSDEEQRRIAQKGGEASAREQSRDDQGQFAGTGSSGGTRSKGGSTSNRGGQRGGSKSQGGSSGGRGQGASRQGGGGSGR